MNKLFHLILIITLVGCSEASKDSASGFEIDTSLPLEERIRFTDLQGEEYGLEKFKGKVVFLNFWATWCRPCIKEMPAIDKARANLESEGVVFLAASDEKMEKIARFAEGNQYQFEIVQIKGDIFDLDIKALPTTFILDSNGKIVYNEVGAREWDSPENLEMIRALVEE